METLEVQGKETSSPEPETRNHPTNENISLAQRTSIRLIRREEKALNPIQIMSDSAFNDPAAAPLSHDPFQAAKASAMRAAEELRTAASQKAHELRAAAEQRATQFKSVATERAGEFRDYADQAFSEAKERYADLRTEGEKFVREKPMQAVLTAFGVGLFVGLILRR